jgi:hypothetical protein
MPINLPYTFDFLGKYFNKTCEIYIYSFITVVCLSFTNSFLFLICPLYSLKYTSGKLTFLWEICKSLQVQRQAQ